MRGIISWIIFFSAGVLCAGVYFYRLHPQHDPEEDLPRIRQELQEALDRAKRLREAWEGEPAPEAAQPAEADSARVERQSGQPVVGSR